MYKLKAMAFSLQVDNEKKRLYSRAIGRVTYEDLRQHMNTDVGPIVASYPEICDCSDVTTDLNTGQVRMLAAMRAQIAATQTAPPVAIIATTNVFFGMMRMFDTLTSQVRPIKVFRDVRSAEDWIDSLSS